MQDEWNIGNILTDDKDELIRKIITKDTFALNIARKYPISTLVSKFGNPYSDKVFDKTDYLMYLLNKLVRREYELNKN